MDLPNVKELEKLLKMLRKQGITDFVMNDMSFKFGDLPREQSKEEFDPTEAMPSDEDLVYWSSQPDPLQERIKAEQ